jgi:hypothetical protein
MPKLYRIVSKRKNEPEDRRVYLQESHGMWGWTASAVHADTFTLAAALNMAKDIRHRWRMPARVEPV